MTRCASCGEENPPGFRLCGYCGAALASLVPERETRKTVTILFTDITGSTGLGEQLDPESLKAVLASYFAAMRQVIERHGGTVEKYIGDAVMAVFGVPVIHEEDALRAARAAVDMREALERLNVDLLAQHGVSLQARTGVNTGSVVVGSGIPGEAIVVGDAVNIAARLQAAAAPIEILIGSATYELIRDAVEVGPPESIELRGKSEPVAIYRLLDVVPNAVGHRRRLDAPMVERERELEALQQAFERVGEGGSSQLFTILGAAGVGKSRLVAEFLGRVRDRARVFRGRCLPYGDGITYLPLAEIVRQATGITDANTADAERQRIETLVIGWPEATAMARCLAGLIGLESTAGQEELVWAFRRMLEQLAVSEPLVVLIDDIHWAEPTLLDLIESVADLTRDSPILFVCPARPEFLDGRPTWGGGRVNATTILLEPLGEGSALKLIDALVPGKALSPAARSRIADGAEGNPLFVEEFVGMLIDDGSLVPSVAGWTASRNLDAIAVPATIQALLAARLDRLEPDERSTAERASVVGRVFEQPAVVAITPEESRSSIPRSLSSLVRKELIRANWSGLTPWETFRFRHILIRDAAYERLPKSERAELHEVFASWLTQAVGDRRAEIDEIIGYHLEQAFRYRTELAPPDTRSRDLARRAATLLIAAGKRALERSDAAATANLYGRAEALLNPDDPARLAILVDLGRSLAQNGDDEQAEATFAEAVYRAQASGDERALAYANVVRYITLGSTDLSATDFRRIADECSATFHRAGDSLGLCLVWRLRGEASWMEGSVAGDEQALMRALQYARLTGSHSEEASIVRGISIDLYWGPTPVVDAIRWCDQTFSRAPDDRVMEVGIAHALAHMHARLGDFELARTLARRCIAIAAESGLRRDAAGLAEVVADVETLAGNHATAERVLAEACDWFLAAGKPNALYEALHAFTQVHAGMSVDVERLAGMMPEQYVSTQALTHGAIAAARLADGHLADAEAEAAQALDFYRTTDFITFHANTALIMGDILQAAGRADEAAAAFEEARDLYQRKGSLVSVKVAEERLSV